LHHWFHIYKPGKKYNCSKNVTIIMSVKFILAAASFSFATAFAPTTNIFQIHNSAYHLQKQSALFMVQGQGDAYKKVFVAGGSKGVGRIVVDKLLEEGHKVVALVRSDEALNELSSLEDVTAIKGDAMEYKDVEGAMDGCDAAISTLGGGSGAGEDGKWVDYVGNNNVIEAAGILGVTRVVLVTSIGCGSSREATPPSGTIFQIWRVSTHNILTFKNVVSLFV
jgi:NADPH:quinone reductase-like Zn-dependent oxidoreductase